MGNHLQYLTEFQQILAHYHIAPVGRVTLAQTKLVLLVGPTAAGRDTIIEELVKTGHYHHIVSDTTRPPRVNNGVAEKNGVEYWFRSEAEFLADLKAGKLLEAEVIHNQQVSGISIRELAKANAAGKVAITNVDLNIKAIVKEKPDTYSFLVLPPDMKEWMRRLSGRSAIEQDEKRRRLETALQIYRAGLEWDFFTIVVNREIAATADVIQQFINTGQIDVTLKKDGQNVLEELYNETQKQLNSWHS